MILSIIVLAALSIFGMTYLYLELDVTRSKLARFQSSMENEMFEIGQVFAGMMYPVKPMKKKSKKKAARKK